MLEWMLFSSLLILLALVVRALGKNSLSCRARYALWLPVLARLLVPIQLFTASWGVVRIELPKRMTVPSVMVMPLERLKLPAQKFYNSDTSFPIAEGYGPDGSVTMEFHGERIEITRYAAKWSIADIVRIVWLAGAGLLAAVLLFSNLRFVRRLRRGRVPLDAPCGGMRVYVAEGLASPCLVGVFRPEVYLTPESARNGRTLRHVLAHEETHKRHGDCVWSALRLIALCLHWYNPLVWYAAIVSKRDGELACDEATLARLGEDERIPYGETLLSMVTAKPGGRELLSFSTEMTAGKRTLRERIETIARRPRARGAALLLSCAVLLGAALFAFSRPTARTPAGHESAPGDGVSAGEVAPAAEDADERETLSVTSSYEVEARRIDGGAWSVAIPAEGWTREGGTWTSEAGSTLRIEPSSDAVQPELRPDTPGLAEAYHPLGDGTGFLVTVRYDPKLQVLSSYLGLEPALLNAMAASFRLKGEAAALPAPATAEAYAHWDADLDGDGAAERLYLDASGLGEGREALLWVALNDGRRLDAAVAGTAHAGWNTAALSELDSGVYLMLYRPAMYQGEARYAYQLFWLENGELKGSDEMAVTFSANPGEAESNNTEAMGIFQEQANHLWSQSRLLFSTDPEVLGGLYDPRSGAAVRTDGRFYAAADGVTVRYRETMRGMLAENNP